MTSAMKDLALMRSGDDKVIEARQLRSPTDGKRTWYYLFERAGVLDNPMHRRRTWRSETTFTNDEQLSIHMATARDAAGAPKPNPTPTKGAKAQLMGLVVTTKYNSARVTVLRKIAPGHSGAGRWIVKTHDDTLLRARARHILCLESSTSSPSAQPASSTFDDTASVVSSLGEPSTVGSSSSASAVTSPQHASAFPSPQQKLDGEFAASQREQLEREETQRTAKLLLPASYSSTPTKTSLHHAAAAAVGPRGGGSIPQHELGAMLLLQQEQSRQAMKAMQAKQLAEQEQEQAQERARLKLQILQANVSKAQQEQKAREQQEQAQEQQEHEQHEGSDCEESSWGDQEVEKEEARWYQMAQVKAKQREQQEQLQQVLTTALSLPTKYPNVPNPNPNLNLNPNIPRRSVLSYSSSRSSRTERLQSSWRQRC
jgi:hypothetical protein